MLKLGKLNINNAYLGSTGVQKMYLGADLVWGGEEPEPNALKFTTNSAEKQTITLTANGTPPTVWLEYSTNGVDWSEYRSESITFDGNSPLYFRAPSGHTNTAFGKNQSSNYYYFVEGNTTVPYTVSGNLLSLLNSDSDVTSLPNYCFTHLFYNCKQLTDASQMTMITNSVGTCGCASMFGNCSKLVNAPALPAKTVGNYAYDSMFNYCSKLVDAPALPARTLGSYCYQSMFTYSGVVNAPALPATSLKDHCYKYMFSHTSIVTAPALPATTLQNACYTYMFESCSKLVNAPALPAKTLVSDCYYNMFRSCTSLVNAPALPAKTIVSGCYQFMFYGCSKLNNITMLATTISVSTALNNWVGNVASTGTFTCASGMSTVLPRGAAGIPTGWTVVEAS